MARILAAMSGGVDSSVAAALLLEQGHEVVGAYMKNWINEEKIVGNCPWEEDVIDAKAVCDQIGIEFQVVNLIKDYRERVVKYLLAGYEGGVTPNPDVMCNREMKFGVFLDHARAEGFDAIATGHYARTGHPTSTSSTSGSADAGADPGAGVDILRGTDPGKDQSYFLALLRQDQVRGARFPIGGLLKSEVREKARTLGLSNAAKKDSQGICFIGEVKMKDFLRTFVGDDPGDVVTVDGESVGQHEGLHLYTLGQRKGLGVASPVFREPYVVVAKRPDANQLVVGFDHADTPGLYARRCRVGSLSSVNRRVEDSAQVQAQPRYRTAAVPVTLHRDGDAFDVVFDAPQRALTPGQICAFYDGDVLLGGGVFEVIHHCDKSSPSSRHLLRSPGHRLP